MLQHQNRYRMSMISNRCIMNSKCKLEEALNILKAKQVTMEIITNMTYIEEGERVVLTL